MSSLEKRQRSLEESQTYQYNVYQTMRLTFEQICQRERPWTALGNFMNHWYSYHREERERLINDPLPESYPAEFHQWAAFCAASVEWFSHTYTISCPEWVYNLCYILDIPWFFERGTPDRLREVTPPEFACRNIFCGEDIYANKWEFVAGLWARFEERLAATGGRPSDDVLPYIEAARERRRQQVAQQGAREGRPNATRPSEIPQA